MATARPEKRRRINTAAVLPDDLLLSEVLVHLPVKSLARCKSVCRSWRAGIADPAFARRHLQLASARRPPSVLAVPREVDTDDGYATSGEISFHRLLLPGQEAPGPVAEAKLMLEQAWPEGISCLILPVHCDGLVAVATATDRVFVCNPITREFVALPLGSHDAQADHRVIPVPAVALGFDRWRNSYVVARYFYRTCGPIFFDQETGEYSPEYDVGHEVFTLGGAGGGSWERTEDPPRNIGSRRPMCTRRAFYWHADVPRPQLLRFGLQDRTFDVVPRPPTGSSSADDMTELGDGKLCYVHAVARASFQVWMADDAPKLEWSLRCRIDLPGAAPDVSYCLMPVMADGDEMLAAVGNKLCRYDVRKGAMEEVVDMANELWYKLPADGWKCSYEPCDSVHYVVPYIESLVSIA